MQIITGILQESFILLNKMAPYLLFGFLFAGIIRLFLDPATIAGHLGSNSSLSVIKASLFGIPLPLCSCGVIPAAASLRKEGASKGAILSFLISTPTTGIDSILATYSLMGGFFAAYRIAASFLAGVLSGLLANIFFKNDKPKVEEKSEVCKHCNQETSGSKHKHSPADVVVRILKYSFGELFADIWKWLTAGILIGGAISYFLPNHFIYDYMGEGWMAMLIMLIAGIPMYVCATGSIPIAAALMLKGLNPGAAFVFLLAGPATNAISMTVVSKSLGKRALAIYIFSISSISILFGYLLDFMWDKLNINISKDFLEHSRFLPEWFEITCGVILIILVIIAIVKEFSTKKDMQDNHLHEGDH